MLKFRYSTIPLIIVTAYLAICWAVANNYVDRTSPVSFHGATEEQILELTAAKNFVEYGFFTNLLLPDYATSPDKADHPFLYTHMPSGPSVLLGSLLHSGMSLPNVRLVFVLFSLFGFFFFYLFTEKLFANPWVALAGTILVTFSYADTLVWSDHFVHSFHWLSIFGTGYFFLRYAQESRRLDFLFTMLFATLSVTTSFLSLVTIVVMTFLLLAFYFRDSKRVRILWATMLAWAFCFVGLLVLRNMIVLGPGVALHELWNTLTNRTFGYPKRHDLKVFFQDHNLALWGSNAYKPSALFGWFKDVFRTFRAPFQVILALIAVLYATSRLQRINLLPLLKALACTFVANAAWYLIFSAHGQNYTLPFIGKMLGILVFMTALSLLWMVIRDLWKSTTWTETFSLLPQARLNQLAIVACLWATINLGHFARGSVVGEVHEWADFSGRDFQISILQDFLYLEKYKSEVIWTNLNSITLSYFTSSKIVGTCSDRALKELNLDQCFALLINDAKHKYAELGKPTLILVSSVLGSSDVFPTEHDEFHGVLKKLKLLYPVEYQTENWILFRVPSKASSSAAQNP